jgi:hypothetical protein
LARELRIGCEKAWGRHIPRQAPQKRISLSDRWLSNAPARPMAWLVTVSVGIPTLCQASANRNSSIWPVNHPQSGSAEIALETLEALSEFIDDLRQLTLRVGVHRLQVEAMETGRSLSDKG